MRVRDIATLAIILLVLSLATVGCAPKPASQTTETTAASAGQPSAAPAAPAAPGQEGAQPQAPAPAPAAGGEEKRIYFDYDKFDISPESAQVLDGIVGFLNSNPELKLQVAGNCDERGTTEYNLALGDRRAKAAKDYCTEKGISGERVTSVSFGEEKPLDPGHTEEAWAKNRRDDFLFSK